VRAAVESRYWNRATAQAVIAELEASGESTAEFARRRGLRAEHDLLREELGAASKLASMTGPGTLEDLRAGRVDVVVEFGSDTLAPVEARVPEGLRAAVTYDESRECSRTAKNRVSEVLERYRGYLAKRQAGRLGIDAAAWRGFRVEGRNSATGRQMGQFILGQLLPLVLIAMLGMGATYPAIDTTAGERERSTWETTMATRAGRGDIVIAKYLYVATMTFVAGALNLAAMVFSMKGIFAGR